MARHPAQRLFAERALLPTGWAENVAVSIGDDGRLAAIEPNQASDAADERVVGPLLPAMANLHSHAFQRAMAGLAEVAGAGDDSFWTWREEMYRTVGLVNPDDVEAIAAKLYVEMLKGGFGRVVEFHYLHHGADGTPYANPAEMSLRILTAAQATGIGLTHLPVFYAHANFGGAAPNPGQRPFLHDPDRFLALIDRLVPAARQDGAELGYAIHSLRAATPAEMRAILDAAPVSGPIHIHVAEQIREVEDCLAWSGRRPVEWLLDEMPVDERWCAIHATHMTVEETGRLAKSGAVAGLCPATEANLGDGIFPAVDYLAAGGRLGIGTDSHVATSVSDELRLLEYGQRLRDRRRNRLAAGPGASVGRTIFDAALAGGAQAAGIDPRGLTVGARADLVVLDGANPYIAAASGNQILDRWFFALGGEAVRDVMVGGQWKIRNGRHDREEHIDRAFARVLNKLK
ncbi:formimidoylglutamate deiminase [Sinorhizobium alkalisoli]|uniref:Formimidoylglutamate deiminase n=1 Tax=Sinorhizobium alkalisoli TaxID=1752398 RepID=A0A1E3VAL3_9HYPH|nr:formimidoylglutamate deiminase [Sinorhizobium alkalisoli]MCA1492496.1 formimidoylglutamate deiminase [Ensifer sp. NBAIM29]ODR90648.1 formimidoylglutamate deiminase [Sinorhizobium alkalisoli]QFI67525.1 Formiminoglutamic iminohydrolase [Sinorhizobium alkalisoli]